MPEFEKKKTKSKKGRYTAAEDAYIREHWMTETDVEIALALGREEKGIARRRKILGLKKPNGRPQQTSRKGHIYKNPSEYNLSKLSKQDRLEFYQTKFDKNPRYEYLLLTLRDNELHYYKAKYIGYIDALDSITHQEEDLLHNMIMKEIQIMRLQRQIKEALDAYYEDEDDARPPSQYLYSDLDKAEQQYVKYQEKLRLTREQRLKIDREEKITITSLVRAFMDAQNRKEIGDMAGVMSYSTKKCREDMNKMNFLIGG